jgi:hypothetical protein
MLWKLRVALCRYTARIERAVASYLTLATDRAFMLGVEGPPRVLLQMEMACKNLLRNTRCAQLGLSMPDFRESM